MASSAASSASSAGSYTVADVQSQTGWQAECSKLKVAQLMLEDEVRNDAHGVSYSGDGARESSAAMTAAISHALTETLVNAHSLACAPAVECLIICDLVPCGRVDQPLSTW